VEKQNKLEEKPFYKRWSFWFVFFYILFVIFYTIAFKTSSGENVLLASNELGDFLAGVFAPLAFLFLYLGYKQQGQELKQNTRALRLQADELRENVKVQNEIMKIQQQEQAAKHFSVQPILKYDSCSVAVNQRQENIYDAHGETIDVGDSYLELMISFNIQCQVNSAYRIKVINALDNSIEDQIVKIDQDKNSPVSITIYEDQIEDLLIENEFDLFFYIEFFDVYGKSFQQKIKINIYQFDWSLEYAHAQLKILSN